MYRLKQIVINNSEEKRLAEVNGRNRNIEVNSSHLNHLNNLTIQGCILTSKVTAYDRRESKVIKLSK